MPHKESCLNSWHKYLAFLLLLSFALLASLSPLTTNDTFWQIKSGEVFLQKGKLPHSDSFTWTFQGKPWVNHEYLACAIFALIDRYWPTEGLLALIFLLLFATLLLLWRSAWILVGDEANRFFPFAAFLACYCLLPRALPRPHIFSILGSAYLIYLLCCLKERRITPFYSFPAVLFLWAQLHGGYLLAMGFLPFTAFWLYLRLRKVLPAVLLLLSPMFLFLGPYGAESITFPFKLLAAGTFMRNIEEWQGLLSGQAWSFPFCVVVGIIYCFAGLVICAVRSARSKDFLAYTLWLCALFLLAVKMRRALVYPVLASTVPLSIFLAERFKGYKFFTPEAIFPFVFIPFITGIPVGFRQVRPVKAGLGLNIPRKACDFLEELGIEGRCYNSYTLGGYLTYRFWPKVLVAIDSRNLVYPEEYFLRYEESLVRENSLRKRMLKEADFALFAAPFMPGGRRPILEALRRDPQWHLVYFDDCAFVFLSDKAFKKYKGKLFSFRFLYPEELKVNTSSENSLKRALTEARKATSLCPHAMTPWILRARASLALAFKVKSSERLFLESRFCFLKASSVEGLRMPPEAYFQLGYLELQIGNLAWARKYVEMALAEAPYLKEAKEILERIRWKLSYQVKEKNF